MDKPIGERMASVETVCTGMASTLDRMERKIDYHAEVTAKISGVQDGIAADLADRKLTDELHDKRIAATEKTLSDTAAAMKMLKYLAGLFGAIVVGLTTILGAVWTHLFSAPPAAH